jgi:hypothetical protein
MQIADTAYIAARVNGASTNDLARLLSIKEMEAAAQIEEKGKMRQALINLAYFIATVWAIMAIARTLKK